ncbi:hypothetical protein IMZ48_36310, partial [Candidatus Bathyarchaeota archaeon]|nr:hypothetical protein [Candidatus Bathyarchaeota archaeon]
MTFSTQRKELLLKLDYDPDSTGADLRALLALGPTLSSKDQERSLCMMESRELAKWAAAERSAVLVVNGENADVPRQSSLSYVCASLASMLKKTRSPPGFRSKRPDVVSLSFFCGQHAFKNKNWKTPSAILNSLLGQLLEQCKEVDPTKALELGDFKSNDVKAAFKRFDYVLSMLPADTTVFCVIDALSFYLISKETSEEAESLATRLMWLVRDEKKKRPCAFKLLLTAPYALRSAVVSGLDKRAEVLNIPCRPGGTGGFTDIKWNRLVRELQGKLPPNSEVKKKAELKVKGKA